jgi:hypothetical protein
MGLILGLSVLFYFPSIIFLLLVFLCLLIIRPFKLTEWILIILAILTPFYFLWGMMFLFKINTHLIYPLVGVNLPHFKFSSFELSAFILIIITASIGFVFIQNNMMKLLVQSRKSWTIFYLFLFFTLLLIFLNPHTGFVFCYTVIIPLSAIASSAFYYPSKRWFPFVSHWSLFLLALYIGYQAIY